MTFQRLMPVVGNRAVRPLLSNINVNYNNNGLFDLLKELSLEAIVEHYTEEALVPCGTDTYQLESKGCPFCRHNDCFKLKIVDGGKEGSLGKCFSCDAWFNDGPGFLSALHGILPYDAAKRLFADNLEYDFSGIGKRPVRDGRKSLQQNPTSILPQRHKAIFEAAKAYYQHALKGQPAAIQYQLEFRGHDLESLLENGVGYADGKLFEYLRNQGFKNAEIVASGLGRESGYDLFPCGSFVYGHMDRSGAVCHFTQKDPKKERLWQLAKKHQLNAVEFYGEFTLPLLDTHPQLLLVEGENDLISFREAGWPGAILAIIGQISKSQLAHLKNGFGACDIITMFDNDDAGAKYRESVARLGLPGLKQLIPPAGYKDPDEAIKKGGMSAKELLDAAQLYQSAQVPISQADIKDSDPEYVLAMQGLTEEDFAVRSDLSNADMLVVLMNGYLKYVREHADWAHFNGMSWVFRAGHQAYFYARMVGDLRQRWASNMPDKTEREWRAKAAAISYATKCHDQARLKAMIALAENNHEVMVSVADFDTDPYLLGVRNGVVCLKTGEIIPPDKSLMLSKQCNANYIADLDVPIRWRGFLERAFSDMDEDERTNMIQYIQRIFGMSLIGKVLVRELYFLLGKPGTGKSVLTNSIKTILGDYAKDLSPNSLMLSSYQSNDVKMPEIANLAGVRIAIATEAEDGQRFNEALLKRITGNDPLPVRDVYAKAIIFRPQCTLFITGNSRPAANGSPAFWSRLKVIRMDCQVPKAEMDGHFEEKLHAEADGILSWLVRGCLAFQAEGMVEPQRVLADSASYRADLDTLAQFIEECCSEDASAITPAAEIYGTYTEWMTSMGMKALGRNRFYERLLEAGYSKKKQRAHGHATPVHVFQGLRLTWHSF